MLPIVWPDFGRAVIRLNSSKQSCPGLLFSGTFQTLIKNRLVTPKT